MLVQHDTDLWSIEHEFGWQAGLVTIPVPMTVIRLVRAELEALGPVGLIVVPRAHGRFAARAVQTFPEVRLLAAPRAPARRRALPFQGALGDEAPAGCKGQLESLLVQGFRLGEVVLLHRASRSLIVPDLCFNVQRTSVVESGGPAALRVAWSR